MKPITIALVLMALLWTVSCTYISSGIYEVEPIAGDSTLISVTTNLDTVDQAILTDSIMVSWEASVRDGELYFVEGILGNQVLVYELLTDYDPDTIPGAFVIRDTFWMDITLPLPMDIYDLDMTWYYSTNSNSLGDYYRVEAYTLSREFKINLGGIGQ